MAGIWLLIIGALLMIFGISLPEIGMGILALLAGITYFAFKFNLMNPFI